MPESAATSCERQNARRRTRLVVVLVVVAIAGAAAIALRPSPELRTVVPQRRDLVELIVASGRLRAPRQSEIGSEIAGVAEAVPVDVGTKLAEGDVLVQLRATDARRQLERAERAAATARAELQRVKAGPLAQELQRFEADLDSAKAAVRRDEAGFQRVRNLVAGGATTQAQLEDARAAMDQALAREKAAASALEVLRAQPRAEDVALAEARVAEAVSAVAIAEEQLARRTIRAPFGGIVVARDVEPGQGVSPGRALVRIADLDRAEVFVETDENNLARLRAGQPATVVAPAFPGRPFAATLAQIDPVVDAQRGVVGLRLTPQQLPEFARVDMTVDVSIEVARHVGSLSLPLSALAREADTWRVMTVAGGVVARVEVRVLGKTDRYAAVEGVGADAVVALDATGVAPGDRVRPVAAE